MKNELPSYLKNKNKITKKLIQSRIPSDLREDVFELLEKHDLKLSDVMTGLLAQFVSDMTGKKI